MQIALPHPLSGEVDLIANPIRFSATPVSYQGPPPLLGEHGDAVLAGILDLPADEIARLRAAGIVGEPACATD